MHTGMVSREMTTASSVSGMPCASLGSMGLPQFERVVLRVALERRFEYLAAPDDGEIQLSNRPPKRGC
jgi:hypothetical protein